MNETLKQNRRLRAQADEGAVSRNAKKDINELSENVCQSFLVI